MLLKKCNKKLKQNPLKLALVFINSESQKIPTLFFIHRLKVNVRFFSRLAITTNCNVELISFFFRKDFKNGAYSI